jgi:hypothetical protein
MERHVAGAIVVHRNPFAGLQVPAVVEPLDPELLERWTKPLYMSFFGPSSDSVLEALWPEMSSDVAYRLLSNFNWRPRRVGAYIVALRRLDELTELVGRLLVRSDVCLAGESYCMALAQLNTLPSRQFLYEYLDYYLTRNNLFFDQGAAMGAIAYLDDINGTREISRFMDKWESFVADKPHWNLARSCSQFSNNMGRVKSLIGKYGS